MAGNGLRLSVPFLAISNQLLSLIKLDGHLDEDDQCASAGRAIPSDGLAQNEVDAAVAFG